MFGQGAAYVFWCASNFMRVYWPREIMSCAFPLFRSYEQIGIPKSFNDTKSGAF